MSVRLDPNVFTDVWGGYSKFFAEDLILALCRGGMDGAAIRMITSDSDDDETVITFETENFIFDVTVKTSWGS